MKLRLIYRNSVSDADGRCAFYEYHTATIEVPDEIKKIKDYQPEIIGGEWLDD